MFTEVLGCLACGAYGLQKYLDLGSQPLANTYQKKYKKLKNFPLEVFFCRECSHSQLGGYVDPKMMFSDYKYVSGTTETLRKHFEKLVDDLYLNNRFKNANIPILEIGCNDGTLLSIFRDRKYTNIEGVDPADNLRKITIDKEIPVLVDFWSSNTAWRMLKNYKVIIGTNVFAHNLNPLDFLKGCSRVLDPEGIVVFEFPYSSSTIVKNPDLGQIYHEHMNYFNVKSFAILAERAGFSIEEVHLTEIHGGSVRFVMVKSTKPHALCVRLLIQSEHEIGLDLFETYENFNSKIHTSIKDLRDILHNYFMAESNIVVYGASAKSSTLLHTSNELRSYIFGFVDDNKLKQGLHTPSGHYIYSPDCFTNHINVSYLIGSPNFFPEIKERLTKSGQHGRLISYSPSIKVEEF